MKAFTKFGNWIFHYRNILFPVFYAALFIPSPVIFHSGELASIAGLLFIGTGTVVRFTTIGLVYIIRGGAKRQIHAETLVTEGIYKVCRNPMYLGNILLLFGFGLFANSLIFSLTFFPLFVLFYVAIISAEEDFLTNKFGEQFVEYKSHTNAIIPKWKNLKTAFTGHIFNWKKVLNKEHNSLFIYTSGIFLLLLYQNKIGIRLFIIVVLISALTNMALKILKIKNLI